MIVSAPGPFIFIFMSPFKRVHGYCKSNLIVRVLYECAFVPYGIHLISGTEGKCAPQEPCLVPPEGGVLFFTSRLGCALLPCLEAKLLSVQNALYVD